jgi:hypothetical protein
MFAARTTLLIVRLTGEVAAMAWVTPVKAVSTEAAAIGTM